MKMLCTSDLYATFSALVRVQTALWNAADQRLREVHGLTLTHVTVLQFVAETEDCRVQDVVDTLHITVGGASKAVDRLVAAGHASRGANPLDRRSSILRVTDAGHEVLAAVTPDVLAVLEDRLGAAISPAELAELKRVLQVLREHSPVGGS